MTVDRRSSQSAARLGHLGSAAWARRGDTDVPGTGAAQALVRTLRFQVGVLTVGWYPWAQPLFTWLPRIEEGALCLPKTPGLGLVG
jgi:hypothetical protein